MASHDRSDTRGTDSAPGTPMVRPGQAVYTLDDHRLGEVADTTGDYFTVGQGLFRARLYIPFEDVLAIGPDRVRVNAAGNEVRTKGWREKPPHGEHRDSGPTRP